MPVKEVEVTEIDYEKIAKFLYNLLEDIDAMSDLAKGNDKAFFRNAMKTVAKRWEVVELNYAGRNTFRVKNRAPLTETRNIE
jgi:hypothetical protein